MRAEDSQDPTRQTSFTDNNTPSPSRNLVTESLDQEPSFYDAEQNPVPTLSLSTNYSQNCENIPGYDEIMKEINQKEIEHHKDVFDKLVEFIKKSNKTIKDLVDTQASELYEKDLQINQQKSLIAEKDCLLAGKTSIISERDSLLVSKDSIIVSKDSIIASKDSIIAEKKAELAGLK